MMSMTKQSTFPAVRESFGSPISKTLWGGLEEMDQLFDRLFHSWEPTLRSAGWRAPLAVWEEPDRYHVEVELAGLSQDAVSVTVQNRRLLIRYERPAPSDRQFVYNERQYGSFERCLALPESTDENSITAEFRDGLLHVTIAKVPTAQPRRIAVQTS